MRTPPSESARDIGARSRAIGVIVWSAFLAIAAGETPQWWTDRLHVYAVGFFFFWIIGLISAALCWQLASAPRREP